MKEKDDWHLTERVEHEVGRGDPFAAAVRATRMPMVITDPKLPDNPIVFCNEAFQTLTGYDREEIIGRNCRFLQGPDTDQAEVARIRQAIDAETPIDVDLLNYRKDGTTFWNALYLSPVRNDDGVVQFFFASQLDVSDRVNAQRQVIEQKVAVESEVAARTADLSEALEAKTLLLHEVDHRVKNNLTMIGSLLRLQARGIDDPVISAKIDAMLERIDALATVHRRLYQSEDIHRFDIGAFAANLADDVLASSGRSDVRLAVETTEINIPSKYASPLGLVLNEVLTNALKHAFNGRSGSLSLTATQHDFVGRIEVWDDGPGFTVDALKSDTLGMTLISRLSRQAHATTAWSNIYPGTSVVITFPAGD